MSRAAVVVLARMGSRRLPGKALRDVGGKPLIARVLGRVALARRATPVVLATTAAMEDEPLVRLACEFGVRVFRGAREDVLGRLIACCDAFGLDRLVRISGDSPFIPPALIDDCIALHDETSAEFVTNLYPRRFPPGASVELITADALRRIAAATNEPADREHVTRFVYMNPDRFDIVSLPGGVQCQDVRLTVDTEADLGRAIAIVAGLGALPEHGALETVIDLARDHDRHRGAAAA